MGHKVVARSFSRGPVHTGPVLGLTDFEPATS